MTAHEVARAITARATELSNRLLVEEEAAFTRAQTVLTTTARDAAPTITARFGAIGDLKQLRRDPGLINGLGRQHRAALDQTVKIATDLAAQAVMLSVDSVEDELLAAGALLDDPSHSTIKAALAGAQDAITAIEASQVHQYVSDVLPFVAGKFVTETRRQLTLATANGNTPTCDEVKARLLSAEPARLPGCVGRGAWFRSLTRLEAALRSVSITTMNEARIAVMRAYNGLA